MLSTLINGVEGIAGRNNFGGFCFSLTVTDICAGWTVNRPAQNKAAKGVFEAFKHGTTALEHQCKRPGPKRRFTNAW